MVHLKPPISLTGVYMTYVTTFENKHILRESTRLLHPQHLGGVWSGLMPYRLPFDTLSEYPEPWLQQTRESLS